MMGGWLMDGWMVDGWVDGRMDPSPGGLAFTAVWALSGAGSSGGG
jgi:hypothetical protein